jgi:hypothetical protein
MRPQPTSQTIAMTYANLTGEAYTQLPPVQLPLQHWSSMLHPTPGRTQQRPPLQSCPLQHCASSEHPNRIGTQHAPPTQARSSQQSAPLPQLSPITRQQVSRVGEHERPPQHSIAPTVHAPVKPTHAHAPPWQTVPAPHVPHASGPPIPLRAGPHERPLQSGAGSMHAPSWQLCPEAHSPQLPPHPSSPHVRPAQLGVQPGPASGGGGSRRGRQPSSASQYSSPAHAPSTAG